MKASLVSFLVLIFASSCLAASLQIGRGEVYRQADGRLEVTGGDPSFAVGAAADERGTFLLAGGEVDVTSGHVRVGSHGDGVYRQTGGRFVQHNGYFVVARKPGSHGRVEVLDGETRCERFCMVVGEEDVGSLVVSNRGVVALAPETRGPGTDEGGLWIGFRATGDGTVRLAAGGTLATRHVRTGAGRATFVFDGGLLKGFAGQAGRFVSGGGGAARGAGG